MALTSGSASALASVKGINGAIIAAGVAAEREVYSSAFKLVYLVSLAFGGTRHLLRLAFGWLLGARSSIRIAVLFYTILA